LVVQFVHQQHQLQSCSGVGSTDNFVDAFGSSLSISGDGNTIAVGAVGVRTGLPIDPSVETANSDESAGAVHVFARNGTQWQQQAFIMASHPAALDFFGRSVDLDFSGSILAVGSENERSQALGFGGDETDDVGIRTNGSGAGYVFKEVNGNWQQASYLKASKTSMNVGGSVHISEDGQSLFMSGHRLDEIYYY